MNNGDGEKYKISRSLVVKARLSELQARCIHFGKLEEFRFAVKAIEKALKTEARTFGEAMYYLPYAKLMARLAAVRPLTVIYGVHAYDSIVYPVKYELLHIGDE